MRKNISLSQQVEERAKAIIEARGFDGLSDLLAALVREEYERRQPPFIQEAPIPYKTNTPPGDEISSERKAELDVEVDKFLLGTAKDAKKLSKLKKAKPPKV